MASSSCEYEGTTANRKRLRRPLSCCEHIIPKLISMILLTSNYNCSEGAFSPLITSLFIPPIRIKHKPIQQRQSSTQHTSLFNPHQNYKRHHKRKTSITINNLSDFPSQEYNQYDDNEEYYTSTSNINNNSQRINFIQKQSLGSIPKDRYDIIMSNKNNGNESEEDEWDSYLNMDIDIEDDDVINDTNMPLSSTKIDSGVNTQTEEQKIDSIKPTTSSESFSVNEMLKEEASVDEFRNQFSAKSKQPSQVAESIPNNTKQQFKPKTRQQRITTDQIQQIKSSISIVDAIETYNLPEFTRTSSVHSSSSTAKACCPFHNDNNPSMSIDDSRGLYKCFACGAGGDIYNFIREYDYLEGNKQRSGKEKMGYMAAVEYAAREFGNTDINNYNFSGRRKDANYEGMSNETKEKIYQRNKKKERIKQANTAAAAFYTKCLVTLPTAGKARAHLRLRHISPESIRSFAIGYAPDCYYGDEKKASSTTRIGGGKRAWGKGSLVEYLAEMKFTPDEIVEAGLATRTKQQNKQQQVKQVKDKDDKTTSTDKDIEYDYSGLMDRFRSRLIIPIMDEGGQNVIGLGGRYLETTSTNDDHDIEKEKEKFIPAKYINSPDSLVFTKKNVLFNSYKAKLALNEDNSKEDKSSPASSYGESKFDAPLALVIVEGYFDAIALSNVGVRNVVASMGTALPMEQLKIAAEMGNVPGGRIILCMDGDDAGINAVERLCSSNILSKVPELNRNELYVATLPDDINVKDPSDFVEYAGDNAQQRFQEEILDTAIPWDEWYITRLVSKYEVDAKDGGIDDSFADICDDVSTFLATMPNPADRTRRVHKIAEMLVDLITADTDTERSASSLNMLRVQFESDILNMSARKAGVREAMERRIEQADGITGDAPASMMERLTSGGNVDMNDDDKKMSKNALARTTPPPRPVVNEQTRRTVSRPPRPAAKARARTFRARKTRERQLPERHLVPHFNGFQFKHESDRDWLGLNGKPKPKMYLGETPSGVEEKDRHRAETPIFENTYIPSRKKDAAVYFNSNSFLGEQYLSPEAIRAGYSLDSSDRPAPGESIADFMENRFFDSDPDQLILQAEHRLLHALSKFPQARAAMRTVYSTSTFGPSSMRWTSEEREWLFLRLTGSPEIDDPLPVELLDEGTPSQLHLHLANRDDCPEYAFNRAVVDNISTPDTTLPDDIIDTPTVGLEYTGNTEDESGNNLNQRSMVEVEVVKSEEDELDSLLDDSSSQAEIKSDSSTVDEYMRNGLLDEYFLETDMFPSFGNSTIAKETRAELTVQETVATLLRATAMKRFSLAKSKLKNVVAEMDRRENRDDAENHKLAANNELDSISSEELQDLFHTVGSEVVDAQKSLYESERSTDRVNSHLLDYSVTDGVQYKQSQAELERLDTMMDDFINSLPEDTHRPDTPGSDDEYVFGMDDEEGQYLTQSLSNIDSTTDYVETTIDEYGSTTFKPFAKEDYTEDNDMDIDFSRNYQEISLQQLKERIEITEQESKSSLVYVMQNTNLVNDDHLLGFLYTEKFDVDVSIEFCYLYYFTYCFLICFSFVQCITPSCVHSLH